MIWMHWLARVEQAGAAQLRSSGALVNPASPAVLSSARPARGSGPDDCLPVAVDWVYDPVALVIEARLTRAGRSSRSDDACLLKERPRQSRNC